MNHINPFSEQAAAARKILSRRFWCAKGWTDRPFEPGEEEFCRQQGYWFPDRGPTAHEMLMEALPRITPRQIGRAF